MQGVIKGFKLGTQENIFTEPMLVNEFSFKYHNSFKFIHMNNKSLKLEKRRECRIPTLSDVIVLLVFVLFRFGLRQGALIKAPGKQ